MTISSWDLGSCALSSGLGWDLLKGVAADHTSRTSLLKSLGKLKPETPRIVKLEMAAVTVGDISQEAIGDFWRQKDYISS